VSKWNQNYKGRKSHRKYDREMLAPGRHRKSAISNDMSDDLGG